MQARKGLIALAACAARAGGCGEDGGEGVGAPERPTLAERQAQLERAPYDLRCAHSRGKVNSARDKRIV